MTRRHRMHGFVVWAATTCLLAGHVSCSGDGSEMDSKDSWYSRYPHYPEYCSTPAQMDKRSIPPLAPIDRKTKLRHVTAITRHGARTIAEGPSENDYHCWDGFWTNEDTGVWDCPLKSMVMPPSPERIFEEEDMGEESSAFDKATPKSMFLYTKSYDALVKPQANILNGTCKLGQLILQGYEQQTKTGQLLREAYLQDVTEDSSDDALILFEVGGTGSQEPWLDNSQLYLRSVDSQETLVSGELIMRGLFEKELTHWRGKQKNSGDINTYAFPTIPVHTADHSRDILGGLRDGCEALSRLQAASDNSWEYQEYTQSNEAKEVVDFLEAHLTNQPGLLDCLMSTTCTDRSLPDRIGIYNPHPNSWFNRISSYFAKNHSFHITYNDGEFSKLSMGPLWAEIMDHVMPVINNQNEDRPRTPAKLALYSGYDSTIMEVLASLGAWEGSEWPPYASMVIIEIHEILDSSTGAGHASMFSSPYAFRLLYNGEIITYKVKGCNQNYQLCDARHLLERVLPFAKRNVDCIDANFEKPNAAHIAKELVTDTAGIILLVLIAAASALVGSMAVFYHLTGSVPTEEIKSTVREQVGRSTNGGQNVKERDIFLDEPGLRG